MQSRQTKHLVARWFLPLQFHEYVVQNLSNNYFVAPGLGGEGYQCEIIFPRVTTKVKLIPLPKVSMRGQTQRLFIFLVKLPPEGPKFNDNS